MYIQTPLYIHYCYTCTFIKYYRERQRETERERENYFVRRSACYIGLFTDTSKCVKYIIRFLLFFLPPPFFPKIISPKKGNRTSQTKSLSLSLSLSHSLTLCSYRYTKPTALLPTPPVVSSKRCVEVCNQSCINGTGDIG